MDYKGFLANFRRIACVMSVNLKEEGENRYFVVDANAAYRNTVVKAPEDFKCNVPCPGYQKNGTREPVSASNDYKKPISSLIMIV